MRIYFVNEHKNGSIRYCEPSKIYNLYAKWCMWLYRKKPAIFVYRWRKHFCLLPRKIVDMNSVSYVWLTYIWKSGPFLPETYSDYPHVRVYPVFEYSVYPTGCAYDPNNSIGVRRNGRKNEILDELILNQEEVRAAEEVFRAKRAGILYEAKRILEEEEMGKTRPRWNSPKPPAPFAENEGLRLEPEELEWVMKRKK